MRYLLQTRITKDSALQTLHNTGFPALIITASLIYIFPCRTSCVEVLIFHEAPLIHPVIQYNSLLFVLVDNRILLATILPKQQQKEKTKQSKHVI